uniref:Odorant receptor n=1 Tax=Bracon brevicornis TaxID=1563983 RepID=A0A6V7JMX1_9HYME
MYGWNYVILNTIGLWPKPQKTRLKEYWALINSLLIIAFMIIPRCTAIPLYAHQIDALVQSCSTQLPAILGCSKIMVLHFRRKELVNYLMDMETATLSKCSNEEAIVIMKTVKLERRISMISGFAGLFVATSGTISLVR